MKKKMVAMLLCMSLALGVFTGCGNGETTEESSAEATETADEEAVEEKTYKIGFANLAEIVQLQIEVKESMERAAEEAGVELVYMNNNMDGATAVKNADNMVQQEIDGFIEFNIDESVGPTIKEKMDDAGIPTLAVDIGIEGCTFFGANNETAGRVAGVRLGEVAKERWGQEPDLLLLVYDSKSGETPMGRVTFMEDGLKEVFPDYAGDKIYMIDGGSDAASAQKAVSDFLSAHPEEKHIAIGTYHDLYATATLAAIETAGREDDCIMVSNNEYGYLDYLKANPEEPENECFVGSVAYFFDRYGDYLIPAMIDILEGEDLGEAFYVEHEVVTRENANELFPEYMAQ